MAPVGAHSRIHGRKSSVVGDLADVHGDPLARRRRERPHIQVALQNLAGVDARRWSAARPHRPGDTVIGPGVCVIVSR